MDRFTESLPAYSRIDRDEDGYPDPPEVEQFTCGCCGQDFPMDQVGTVEEPECTCIQTDVDFFDARYCDAHGDQAKAEILICQTCDGTEDELQAFAMEAPEPTTAELFAQIKGLLAAHKPEVLKEVA